VKAAHHRVTIGIDRQHRKREDALAIGRAPLIPDARNSKRRVIG
jgi:hypothetical protein